MVLGMVDRVNPRRMVDYGRRLLAQLPRGMRAEFSSYDFSGEGLNYATISFISKEGLKGNLEEWIGCRLNPEMTGVRASLRFIQYHESRDGRFWYVAEVVPLEGVERREWDVVTEDFLHRLVPVLKSFWKVHYSRDKRER
jgi:hypothetical protein